MEKQLGITWPKLSTINKNYRAIIISLGGSSGSSTPDHIKSFSKRFKDGPYYTVKGTGKPITISREIFRNTVRVYKKIKEVSGIERPKVIMVGKSMGGCKLYRATKELDKRDIKVDLFIGVDVSCSPHDHYFDFTDSYGKIGGLHFRKNVLKIYNFYQKKKNETQTGHPLLLYNDQGFDKNIPPYFNKKFNIDINKDKFSFENLKRSNRGQTISTKNTGHGDIDTQKRLLEVIEKLVYQELA